MCLKECIYFLNIFTSEICAPYIQSFFQAMSVFKAIKSQSYLLKVKVCMVAFFQSLMLLFVMLHEEIILHLVHGWNWVSVFCCRSKNSRNWYPHLDKPLCTSWNNWNFYVNSKSFTLFWSIKLTNWAFMPVKIIS